MKKTACLIILILFTVISFGQDKVSIKSLENFKTVKGEKTISTIDLSNLSGGLNKAAMEFLQNNTQLIAYSLNGNKLELSIETNKTELVIYQKLFYLMGIHQIEIKKGDAKGVYSMDDFFKLLN